MEALRAPAPELPDLALRVKDAGHSGWGAGEDSAAKRLWAAETWPWAELAPVIAAGLARPFLSGIRIFIGQGGSYENCEVTINGLPHEPSAAALAAMDCPGQRR
jgi:hypothetical protein